MKWGSCGNIKLLIKTLHLKIQIINLSNYYFKYFIKLLIKTFDLKIHYKNKEFLNKKIYCYTF